MPKKKGRPKELPSRLPKISQDVVMDPLLCNLELQSSQVQRKASILQRKKEKQEAKAKELARQRANQALHQLFLADQHAKISREHFEKRVEKERMVREAQQQELNQLRLAVEAGEVENLPPQMEAKLRKYAGFGKKNRILQKSRGATFHDMQDLEHRRRLRMRLVFIRVQ